MLHVGCAIWAYDGWANGFFPSGLPKDQRLQAYARRLTAVEGNTTFYAVPQVPVVQRWAADTPDYFRFSPKFPRAITHTAQLKDVGAQTGSFIGVMRILGERLGPLMLQLPPSFGPSRLRILQDYLDSLPEDIRVAVEIRHQDWFTEENSERLNKILIDAGASRIVFDVRPAHKSQSPDANSAKERKPDVPLIPLALQNEVVVRYIGSPVEKENEPYFEEWVPRIVAWLAEKRDVYFYAHCPMEELSPAIARDLYHRVAAKVNIPPLPWDELEKPPPISDFKQLSLF
jgi:uncharacterized protein YecE (DUF72 family)